MKITAIIPTYNEEKHIANAIESVSFADEIIVIDSFSTDKTVEIVKESSINLIQRKFDDFSSQKNHAILKAKHQWIFVLDADERVTPKLKEEILQTIKKDSNIVAYWVFRTYHFMGRRIKYGGWQRDKVIRLFKKNECKYDGRLVHEEIETFGKISFLKNKLEHYSYNGFDHYIYKLNQYAWLQAKALHKKGKKVNLFHILLKPAFRFFKQYIIRLGFLDGFPGFVSAFLQAYGVLTRYIKLWLLYRALK
ncbi:MAG: glycosyltransferase family 2 protein [Proteobacteria bacterium]|nr:glycosyltransferase family 2 protein [Pseudomonadota bacterium]